MRLYKIVKFTKISKDSTNLLKKTVFVGDRHTDTHTDIYSLFRDKLSLPMELVLKANTPLLLVG